MIVLIVLISMIRCIHSLVRTCPVFPTVLSGYCQVVTSQRWSPNIPIVHSLAGINVQDGQGGVCGGSSNISVLNIALVCWAESQLDNNPGICWAWLHHGHLGYILLVLSFSADQITISSFTVPMSSVRELSEPEWGGASSSDKNA